MIFLNSLQFLQEGARIQAQLTLSLTTLAKTKEKYEKVGVSNIRECTLHISNTNTDINTELDMKRRNTRKQMGQLLTDESDHTKATNVLHQKVFHY